MIFESVYRVMSMLEYNKHYMPTENVARPSLFRYPLTKHEPHTRIRTDVPSIPDWSRRNSPLVLELDIIINENMGKHSFDFVYSKETTWTSSTLSDDHTSK